MNNIITAQQNGITPRTEITEGLFNRYIAFLDASPKTVQTYSGATRQFIKWLKEHGITQPTREDIITYRDELKENHKPSTVQNYIVAIRLFFQWTEQEGIYPNIAQHVKGAKVDRSHKKDYLTANQIKEIIAQMPEGTPQARRDYAIFVLMTACGLRDIEVQRANIGDLRTLGEDTVLYLQGKGHEEKSDFVRIPPVIEKAIRASIADRENKEDTQPLFISMSNNSRGKRISTRSISGIIKNAMKRAGYDSDRLTAHSLRHTAITLALLNGQTLEEAQQFARHRNIATTLIYSHHLDATKNNCSNTVASVIF